MDKLEHSDWCCPYTYLRIRSPQERNGYAFRLIHVTALLRGRGPVSLRTEGQTGWKLRADGYLRSRMTLDGFL